MPFKTLKNMKMNVLTVFYEVLLLQTDNKIIAFMFKLKYTAIV